MKESYLTPQAEILALHSETGFLALSDPKYNTPFENEEDW